MQAGGITSVWRVLPVAFKGRQEIAYYCNKRRVKRRKYLDIPQAPTGFSGPVFPHTYSLLLGAGRTR
jgi:hypothetical protein